MLSFSPSEKTAPNGFSTDWNFGDSEFDEPYAGDFNGDGRTEFALLRQASAVTLTLNIETGIYSTFNIGAFDDVPVPGDYDLPQDGKTDLAAWQPSLGWRVISSATGVETTTSWGETYDIAVPADYDGDGTTDIAVVRPSNGTFGT